MNNIVNFHFDNFRIWFFFHLKFEILILILVILEFENFNFKKVGFTIKTNFNWMNNIVDDFDHEPKYCFKLLDRYWIDFDLNWKAKKILKI